MTDPHNLYTNKHYDDKVEEIMNMSSHLDSVKEYDIFGNWTIPRDRVKLIWWKAVYLYPQIVWQRWKIKRLIKRMTK